ncbi:hypothetical protein WLZ34_05015 [Thermogladius sp. KZ2Tp1]|uniref:hypothetical protein n=1 Tax=Thermogladius sp. KZ2Tp1 TaxID=3136289 RepID=UPI003DA9FFEB
MPVKKSRKQARPRTLKAVLVKPVIVYLLLIAVLWFTPPVTLSSGGASVSLSYEDVYYCFYVENVTLYLQPQTSSPLDVPVYVYLYTGNSSAEYKLASFRYYTNLSFYDDIGGTCIRINKSTAGVSLNTGLRILVKLPGFYLAPMPPSGMVSFGNGSYLLLFHQAGYATAYSNLSIYIDSPVVTVTNNLGFDVYGVLNAVSTNGTPVQEKLYLRPRSSTSIHLIGNYTAVHPVLYARVLFLTARVDSSSTYLSLKDNMPVIAGLLAIPVALYTYSRWKTSR